MSYSFVSSELKFLNNSEIRLRIMVLLLDGPYKMGDINKISLLSYSSISSNIHKLCQRGYVEKVHNSFQLTNLGFIYLTALLDFKGIVSIVNEFSNFWLDHDIGPLFVSNLRKLAALNGSKLIENASTDIYRTHNEFKNAFKDSKNLKVIFPYLHPEYPNLVQCLILNNVSVEVLLPKEIIASFVNDVGSDVVNEGVEKGIFSIKYLKDDVKLALAISNKFVSVGLFKSDGSYDQNRLLISDKESAISWALEIYKTYEINSVKFNMSQF